MNRIRRNKGVGWRVVICCLLLLWIFHSIFLNEARSAAQRQGQDWLALSTAEQRRAAWSVGPTELVRTLKLIQPGWLLLSVMAVGATLLLGALRWHSVLRMMRLDLPFPRVLEISMVAHFFNAFLLGSTGGDFFKAYYAARETHHQKTHAVAAVFADRLIGLFSMLLFALFLIASQFDLVSRHRPLGVASLLVAGMFLACGGVISLAFWGGLSNAWPRARLWLRGLPKGLWLDQSLDACRLLGRNWGVLLWALVLSMLLNVACVLQFLALSRGLDLQVTAAQMFLAVPIVICLAAIPITPSGLGLRENLFVLILAHPALGAPATEALTLSLLGFAGSVGWSLIGGLVYLTYRHRHNLETIDASV